MIETKALARSLAVLACEGGSEQVARAHLTPEELVAYRAGDLSAEKDQEVQEHLILCPYCPDLLLALRDFSEPPRDDASLPEAGVAAAWRRFRKRLLGEARFEQLPKLLRRGLALPRPVLAVVGVGLSAALVMPWFLVGAPGRLNPLLVATEIEPLTRGGVQSTEVLSSGKGPITLTVSPVGPAYPEYEVDLFDAAGRRLRSERTRPGASFDSLVIQLPRSTPAGEYRLLLRGFRDGRPAAEPADERRFRLTYH